ncbi:helix-turn-helix domain-containing protein [Motiliproteus coralliicola]|uniref:Helix-turn-helix domain-containing protein n=1 Tax=Motiliproteus coralliicola TaxID=2283196 RepID=A0A369WJS9_9GAMM|nr:helix-turn-helix domain-containing protein [Motiliproteus coralliicola]RDE19705.1 helix-turn-helix domain-containing protein [Motiliproteus coralliicola]
MNRVAILAHEQVTLFELACAVEIFGLERPEYDDWYRCDVVSLSSGPFRTSADILISTRQVESLSDYDTLVIPSWPVTEEPVVDRVTDEVSQFDAEGKRILTFCSGAFLLGRLGLLDGRKATTHWLYTERFRQQFPQVDYVDNVLYVFDGRLGCSAGSAAGIDLGIEVIRQDYGYQRANQVARRLVMSPQRKGGQAQFVETPVIKSPSQFAGAIDWVLANLSQPISVDQMAEKACMSRRSFDRKFRAAYDCSANAWLIQIRLNRAKTLLESESCSIDKVAEQSGFDNATSMRYHFDKQLGISPKEYRVCFHRSELVMD